MRNKIFVTMLIIISVFTIVSCNNSYMTRSLDVSAEDVALLTIFSDDGTNESTWLTRNYGHSFLSITNIGDNDLTIGDMIVPKDESITIGLWSIMEHFGIWYNIESNYIKEYNKYNNRVSITIGINKDDISKINEVIKKNAVWTPWYNCSKFAIDVWNVVATDSEKINSALFVSPGYLVKEIKNFDEFELNRDCITSTTVRYFGEV